MKTLLIKFLAKFPYSIKKLVLSVWFYTPTGRVSNSGERLVVSSWRELVDSGEFYHLYHAYRYWWANKQIPILPTEAKVLDLGCGTGYGSWLLLGIDSHFLFGKRFVVGYDPNETAIRWAKEHFNQHGNCGLTFTSEKDWINQVKFDYVTSFEVIEHAPQDVMNTIFESLNKNGTLFISTANGGKESVRQYLIDHKLVTANPTHELEFSPEAFRLTLENNFSNVQMFGQCVKDVHDFEGWLKWRRKNNVILGDFEMRSNDFTNCEVIVARCRF